MYAKIKEFFKKHWFGIIAVIAICFSVLIGFKCIDRHYNYDIKLIRSNISLPK